MRSQKIADSFKNAIGTVFLLAGAFFVCSTFLSMRSVFADPVAPVVDPALMGAQSGRAGNPRATTRVSPRNNATTSRRTVARTGVVTNPARAATISRAVSSRATTATPRSNVVTSRGNATATRNVVSRGGNVATRANVAPQRTVRARTATTSAANNARISLQGSAIRGSKAAVSNVGNSSSSYSYLTGKLYTGNYSNIIDSTTGLISADAFNNCLESYYTCMDEICTARNAAQRRCACAGRVRAFATAEAALETANEELIKVSGELALLIANKGKDVSSAFQLTEAEQVMNCVSWQKMADKYSGGTKIENGFDIGTKWCQEHGFYENELCSGTKSPSYCTVNSFGFDVNNLKGTGSDILATLQAWADAKDQTKVIVNNDTQGLLDSFNGISNIVDGMSGLSSTLTTNEDSKDSLAETWGYELFEYAHNNVCARVLDSCFNGIYEACGAPSGANCNNGAATCPYNYNSVIKVDKDNGGYNLNFITAANSATSANTAACFGYTSTSGDPYASLRGPVADARRSIMQKYALDANADCDLYGEQIRQTAQNISYQKVAAEQSLQQKRLEFAQEEEQSILNAATTAMSNFNECLSEIYECYVETADSEDSWPTARIKTYCAQIANIPHCYEEMVCSPSGTQFTAVIDKQDNTACKNSQDYTTNTCRNVVTLNEILNGAYDGSLSGYVPNFGSNTTEDSAKLREYCLRNAMGIDLSDVNGADDQWNIRNWAKETTEPTTKDCTSEIPNAYSAVNTLKNGSWTGCKVKTCQPNYDVYGNTCVASKRSCAASDLKLANAKSGTETWTGSNWGNCVLTDCADGYDLDETNNLCVGGCTESELKLKRATAGKKVDGTCILTECMDGYVLNTNENKCTEIVNPDEEKCKSTGGTWKDNTCTCSSMGTLDNGYCVINTDFLTNNACASQGNENTCKQCANTISNTVYKLACDAKGNATTAGASVYIWEEGKCKFNTAICD
ncbi:MAG: hypothetical protein IKW67_01435 [Alphaproteobacteria bacterium]|nr:hypothetical protein [Alphaproteobacteria bacterium]